MLETMRSFAVFVAVTWVVSSMGCEGRRVVPAPARDDGGREDAKTPPPEAADVEVTATNDVEPAALDPAGIVGNRVGDATAR